MSTPTLNDPFGLLRLKKTADLAGGAFVSLEPIPPALRSRYSNPAADATIELGLGYVQAVLAALTGVVAALSYDEPGNHGRVSMRSSRGSRLYEFTWLATPERLLLGGFPYEGNPTYQVAVVGLCQAFAANRAGATAPAEELIARWCALVGAMQRAYPRASAEAGWDKRAVEAACRNPDTRPQIVATCDALRVALRSQVPAARPRARSA